MQLAHRDHGRPVSMPGVRRSGRVAVRAAVPILLVALMALAGCGGSEPDSAWPTIGTTGTTAPTAHSTAAGSATTTPATTSGTGTGSATTAATSTSEEGDQAIAAVQAYYTAVNSASVSRSSALFRERFLPECDGCLVFADQIDMLAKEDLTLIGGHVSATDLVALEPSEYGIGVTGTLTSTSAKTVDANGHTVKEYDSGVHPGTIWILKKDHNTWKVASIGIAP